MGIIQYNILYNPPTFLYSENKKIYFISLKKEYYKINLYNSESIWNRDRFNISNAWFLWIHVKFNRMFAFSRPIIVILKITNKSKWSSSSSKSDQNSLFLYPYMWNVCPLGNHIIIFLSHSYNIQIRLIFTVWFFFEIITFRHC